MRAPRVSIITATYNRSGVLRHAIESVLGQSLADFEMLIVGDGCTDDSAEVVASFADPRLRWRNLEQNSGHQSTPNNIAAGMARGEYLAYLGHDDIWHPTHLSELVAALDKSGADVAYALTELILPPPSPLRILAGLSPSGQFEPDLGVAPSSLLLRRSLLDEIGGWKHYRTLSEEPEVDLLRRAFEAGKKFICVEKLTVFKFNSAFRPNSYVENASHEQASYIRRIKEEPDFLERELAAIVRSYILRHPEDVPRAHDWRNEAAGTAVQRLRVMRGLEPADEYPEQFPVVASGRIEVATPSADRYLGRGWAAGEPVFRWTIGKEAIVTFSLEQVRPIGVRLALSPFLGGGRLPEQKIQPFVNGHPLPPVVLASEEVATIEIELPSASLQDQNRLALGLPNATSPAALGLSLDVRPLALAVRWIEFE